MTTLFTVWLFLANAGELGSLYSSMSTFSIFFLVAVYGSIIESNFVLSIHLVCCWRFFCCLIVVTFFIMPYPVNSWLQFFLV